MRTCQADYPCLRLGGMFEKPISPARPAASMLFIRDGVAGLEVFMVARSPMVSFAANALVFPGGKVTPDDATLANQLESGTHLTPMHRAYAVAALRESFEEAGLLLAHQADGAPVPEARVRALDPLRSAIDQGTHSFADMLTREGLRLNLNELHRFAHIITPRLAPKRFDTHFYIAPCPPAHNPVLDMHEVVAGFWLTATQAKRDYTDRFTLMRPTLLVLDRLASSATVADALLDAASFEPEMIEPRHKIQNGQDILTTQAVQGFAASVEIIDTAWAKSVGEQE
jgi:8-oxo-dGTP pyrophosphatase MutT (NUDIX family)